MTCWWELCDGQIGPFLSRGGGARACTKGIWIRADSLRAAFGACREMPGELESIMVWFRDYKIPDGKPPNKYGFDSKPMNSDFAKLIIEETHGHYKNLKDGVRVNDKALALE